MPQATEELRAKFPGGDLEACIFLQNAGWMLTDHWEWVPPNEPRIWTIEEHEAMCYLIDEWDYGGIVD